MKRPVPVDLEREPALRYGFRRLLIGARTLVRFSVAGLRRSDSALRLAALVVWVVILSSPLRVSSAGERVTRRGLAAPIPPGQTHTNTIPEPYLRHRDRLLEVTGVEGDLANQTTTNEIRVAWFGPSNIDHPTGGGMWWAAQRAFRETNETNGYNGRTLRLIPCWTENPWGTGVSQLFRTVYNDGVRAILGSIDGPTTHLAEQVVAKARLVLLSPVATDKSINLAGVPWMFSVTPPDDAIAPILTAVVLKGLEPDDQLILLAATDHDSRMITREIQQLLSQNGHYPEFEFEFTPGAEAAGPQLEAIAEARPKAVIIIAAPADAARWVRALRRRSVVADLFGSHQLGRRQFRDLTGPDAIGIRYVELFVPDRLNPETERFIQAYKAEFNRSPDYAEAYSYDAARLLAEAICRSDLTRSAIRDALTKLSPWRGITGSIEWNGTGQNMRTSARVQTIQETSSLQDPR